jgi:hypothetical protein
MNMDIENIIVYTGVAILAALLVVVVMLVLLGFVAHVDFFPASGNAYGYIYFQQKGGLYQQFGTCWKDTPYVENCEWMDTAGKVYEPGPYRINFTCRQFVWNWEAASECSIISAQKVDKI